MLDRIKNKKVFVIFLLLISIISFYYYNNVIKAKDTSTVEESLEIYSKEDEKIEQSENNIIKVHITGAVNNEGIVELESDSRLSDAIDKAGGLKSNADLANINLACILEDGAKIYIPKLEDANNNEINYSSSGVYNSIDITNSESNSILNNSFNVNSNAKSFSTVNGIKKKVNINTATQDELETLSGIGTSTAKKIISYRNEVGKFKKIDDIKKVNGIGEAKFNKIKDFITIK